MKQLSDALSARRFEAAQELIEEYGKELSVQLQTEIDMVERAAVLTRARHFLNDQLHLARVIRAHIAAELKAISAASQYREQPAAANTWELEG